MVLRGTCRSRVATFAFAWSLLFPQFGHGLTTPRACWSHLQRLASWVLHPAREVDFDRNHPLGAQRLAREGITLRGNLSRLRENRLGALPHLHSRLADLGNKTKNIGGPGRQALIEVCDSPGDSLGALVFAARQELGPFAEPLRFGFEASELPAERHFPRSGTVVPLSLDEALAAYPLGPVWFELAAHVQWRRFSLGENPDYLGYVIGSKEEAMAFEVVDALIFQAEQMEKRRDPGQWPPWVHPWFFQNADATFEHVVGEVLDTLDGLQEQLLASWDRELPSELLDTSVYTEHPASFGGLDRAKHLSSATAGVRWARLELGEDSSYYYAPLLEDTIDGSAQIRSFIEAKILALGDRLDRLHEIHQRFAQDPIP